MDLGVIVDGQLKFPEHTAVAVKKANQILGLIKKSYSSRDPYTITTLYKTIVRPHDVHQVEKIHRRARKMIYSIKNLPYEQRLRTLKLHLLSTDAAGETRSRCLKSWKDLYVLPIRFCPQ